MTKEEAENLKVFENPCMCGGFAWSLNGRPQEQPQFSVPFVDQRWVRTIPCGLLA